MSLSLLNSEHKIKEMLHQNICIVILAKWPRDVCLIAGMACRRSTSFDL